MKKPKKPKKPVQPRATLSIERSEEICGGMTLEAINQLFPPEITIDGVGKVACRPEDVVAEVAAYDYTTYLTWKKEIANPRYSQELDQYQRDLEEYESRLEAYERDRKAYDEHLKREKAENARKDPKLVELEAIERRARLLRQQLGM